LTKKSTFDQNFEIDIFPTQYSGFGVYMDEENSGFDFYMPDDHDDPNPKKKRRYIPRHECPHCHKKFVRPAELQRHVRIHTGEKPFQLKSLKKIFRRCLLANFRTKFDPLNDFFKRRASYNFIA